MSYIAIVIVLLSVALLVAWASLRALDAMFTPTEEKDDEPEPVMVGFTDEEWQRLTETDR